MEQDEILTQGAGGARNSAVKVSPSEARLSEKSSRGEELNGHCGGPGFLDTKRGLS